MAIIKRLFISCFFFPILVLGQTNIRDNLVDTLYLPQNFEFVFQGRSELQLRRDEFTLDQVVLASQENLQLVNTYSGELGIGNFFAVGMEARQVLSHSNTYFSKEGEELASESSATGVVDPQFFLRYRFTGLRGLGSKGDVVFKFSPPVGQASTVAADDLSRGSSQATLGLELGKKNSNFELAWLMYWSRTFDIEKSTADKTILYNERAYDSYELELVGQYYYDHLPLTLYGRAEFVYSSTRESFLTQSGDFIVDSDVIYGDFIRSTIGLGSKWTVIPEYWVVFAEMNYSEARNRKVRSTGYSVDAIGSLSTVDGEFELKDDLSGSFFVGMTLSL